LGLDHVAVEDSPLLKYQVGLFFDQTDQEGSPVDRLSLGLQSQQIGSFADDLFYQRVLFQFLVQDGWLVSEVNAIVEISSRFLSRQSFSYCIQLLAKRFQKAIFYGLDN
jgi:hypothetical protein